MFTRKFIVSSLFASFVALFTPSSSSADFQAFNYDTPAFIDFELGEIRVNESAGQVAINLIRTGEFRQLSRIEYKTTEIDASEGRDYAGSGGTITFQPGEGYKTVLIDLIRDEREESPESFRFEISAPDDPTVVIFRDSVLITIEDAPRAISQPELRIVATGDGTILLSWVGSDRSVVERSATARNGTWEALNSTPVLAGGRCEVLQPIENVFYFYRLRLP